MKKIRGRDSLINYILDSSPRRSIRRAILEGTVEYLGGFSEIPPGTDPGWILRVNSPITGKHWNVAVIAVGHSTNYRLQLVDKVRWEFWVGYCGNAELYRGDNPDKYVKLRDEIRSIIDG